MNILFVGKFVFYRLIDSFLEPLSDCLDFATDAILSKVICLYKHLIKEVCLYFVYLTIASYSGKETRRSYL